MAKSSSAASFDEHAGIEAYVAQARTFDLLAAEEEEKLFAAWRDRGDRRAYEKLAKAYLRLAIKVARGYKGYGLPIEDLIGQANVGLTQALHKFEPDKGFRFATYAVHWIRAAIQEYALANAAIVKLGTTANRKKLFYGLQKAKDYLGITDGPWGLSDEDAARIADVLHVSAAEVLEMSRSRMSPKRLDAKAFESDDSPTWNDILVDENAVNQEEATLDLIEKEGQKALLERAMAHLKPRERMILTQRQMIDEPATLEEIAVREGVSRERIRQIEAEAFNKVNKSVQSMMREQFIAAHA